ncbi:AhpA/YtjB family protein [Aliidiomarina minuta]|nr:AhpA/YtjB family protein [Aliidiomarina minuta]
MQTSLINWSKHWLISGEHLYRRILQFAVAVFLAIWILQTWYSTEKQGEEVRVLHTEQLARVILSQAVHEARIWLSNDNSEGLEGLAQHLQNQDGILEVSIQDSQGKPLVRSGHDQDVHSFLRELPTHMWAVPMVKQIEDLADGNIFGYMRITFDYNRIMADSHVYQRAYMQQTGFMLFLAALAGALAATAFLKRRPRPTPPTE